VIAPSDAPGTDPLSIFQRWHAESTGEMPEPDAMVLATATLDGAPSARYVLLRGITEDGVRFFTNYESRKGVELASNPRAAIAWFGGPVRRQVRVEGETERLSDADSDAYFASRGRGHQLGAVASAQSSPLGARSELEDAYAAAEARFEGRDVERPRHWGGYLLRARTVELWSQREDRLHDRFSYVRNGSHWEVTRLAP
jgi:pyridoxamine 5'-phosphate oxidase